jgi:hypothetical protein
MAMEGCYSKGFKAKPWLLAARLRERQAGLSERRPA